ncbi:MAG: hypothetical protein MJZ95_03765 [Paludibacteraceae bacterium]|nr:hypothetical protein [Paludibacteraceae bacterium]
MVGQFILQLGDNSHRQYDREYLLVDCRCVMERSFNHVMPNGSPLCDEIEMVFVSPGASDMHLLDWYISKMELNGRIVMNRIEHVSDSLDERYIMFEDASCFSLSEIYDIENPLRRLLKLKIKPRKVNIDDVIFE